MPTLHITPPRRSFVLLLAALGTVLGVVAFAGPAAAHNTFVSSDPADGAVVAASPARVAMIFGSPVPLDTASVQVIDAAGARTEVASLTHGPTGDTEVVALLPTLSTGQVTVRWRLVGPDGHPLTGRIVFTVASAFTTTTSAAVTGGYAGPTTLAVPPTTLPAVSADDLDGDFSTPGLLRWMLRYGAYLAIMTLIGIVLTDALVWPGSAKLPFARVLMRRSVLVVAATAALQLVVLASDVSGRAPWGALGSLDTAGRTSAGTALVIRLLLVGCAALLLQRPQRAPADVHWSTLGFTGMGLMGTWAFAGHSASQRWPLVGVPLDVLHHTAAALWIGSLAMVGIVAIRALPAPELALVVPRLGRGAATAVAVIVGTGLAQSIRLVGNPGRLLDGAHGRYLLVKIAVMGAMLILANANRQRVTEGFGRPSSGRDLGPRSLGQLRRGILVEFGLGLVILAITAALVVSPPATAGL